ncbi:GlxA family transcriptional regulator [Paraburkholderia sp. BCC1886]|uniref:GlxA family transcriptional regulator n=1 Tax=Paraburkholderia sp. BCC1886 TaxID=2562670 RepID=UPI0021B1BBB5|nr:GlxA family transcriptional regulator [Paraburkholderia sp. BCC1886]
MRTSTTHVLILAIPPISISSLAPLIDPLTLANEIDGHALYSVQTCTPDGRALSLSANAYYTPDTSLSEATTPTATPCDWLIVLSDRYAPPQNPQPLLAALNQTAQRAKTTTGIHHGVWWLAQAGALAGYRVSMNWQSYQQFAEQFDNVIVTQHIFEIDRDRATCAGGQATLDFMLAMIGRDHGPDLVERIADSLGAGALRNGEERQRIPFVTAPGERHPRLNEALQLMEANVEEPLTSDDIANLVGISRRQLERLFRQYLGSMPAKYYLGLRLAKARAQLQRTSKSVVQISLACGFASAAHFSNAYRDRFGVTPREDRRNWIDRQTGATSVGPTGPTATGAGATGPAATGAGAASPTAPHPDESP